MLSRRTFLVETGGALAFLGLPVCALGKTSMNAANAPGLDNNLKAECKVKYEGQFVARLKLVGLQSPYCEESRLAQYILNFESAEPVYLVEATYEISHPTLGRLDLFLQPCGMPVRQQHNGIQYRACMAMLR